MAEVPPDFMCPISQDLMKDPVITADGQSYERDDIEQWFRNGNRTSPSTGAVLPHTDLTPNHALRNAIETFCEKNMLRIRRSALTLESQPIGAGSSKRVFRGTMQIPGAPRPIQVAVLEMRHGKVVPLSPPVPHVQTLR